MSDKLSRKCTRSAKGLAFDEMKETAKSKSPKKKLVKTAQVKPKASRKIVFNDEPSSTNAQVNNNATSLTRNREKNQVELDLKRSEGASKKSSLRVNKSGACKKITGKVIKKTEDKGKLLDPCFKNVFQKEYGKQQGISDNRMVSSEFQNRAICVRDGFDLEVEDGIEELDYVDDILDGDELIEYECAEHEEANGHHADGVVDQSSLGNARESQIEATQKGMQSSTGNCLPPSTSTGKTNISDEELAQMPQVKNLFNKFREEKMKELKKGEKQGKNDFIKSPSDTTLYAPALNKSPVLNLPLRTNNNVATIDNIVSNFVENVRLEQRQEENASVSANVDLQEKER